MKAERLWPLALAAVLVATVLANVGVMVVAGRDGGAAVEPDYYRRAVAWDSTLAAEARSRALGWHVAAELSAPADAPARSTFAVEVRDSAGVPVAGAAARIESYPVARSTHRLALPLVEGGAGRYAAVLPVRRVEWHEVDLVVTRGSARFAARLRCLPGAACRAA